MAMQDQFIPSIEEEEDFFKDYVVIANEDVEEIKDALKEGRMDKAVSKIMENLQALEKTHLDIAVTGESGSGKSSFVNAIRGLGDEEAGSAPTGVVETTEKPTPYPHPKDPNVTLWDLPGIGTPTFRASTYLRQVRFSRYDFFILIASERFKASHVQLAQEICRQGKQFYFVRSKVDADLEASRKRRPQTYDEEAILGQMREHCRKCLRAEDMPDSRVFLLSNWEINKYDFMMLEETLEKELPSHKRHAFLLSLPNISLDILQKKKMALQKEIWKLATVSAGAAAVPIPGVGVACDVTILIKYLSKYRDSFGLDEESLARLAKKANKSVEEIKEVIKSPLAKEISRDLVLKLLTKAGGGALMVMEYFVSTIPIFGSVAAGGISFGTTFYMLKSCLDEVANDAQQVFLKAFESEV
ncbi:interferon-inducible GTPase 5-like [Pantherophis guttatus]|uniref:Interferon-inducible GTPase 5-like n=1 Tax=Pantherophis guttatus TaxID=94885 RepID=A0ABM3ZNC5_PANGU|nr:interferon-inducible GTPase 5-like [Pantherophis guttatus]XP_060549863.1 interferon-inducible GTPase 5-like [Pantherophis guttatus]